MSKLAKFRVVWRNKKTIDANGYNSALQLCKKNVGSVRLRIWWWWSRNFWWQAKRVEIKTKRRTLHGLWEHHLSFILNWRFSTIVVTFDDLVSTHHKFLDHYHKILRRTYHIFSLHWVIITIWHQSKAYVLAVRMNHVSSETFEFGWDYFFTKVENGENEHKLLNGFISRNFTKLIKPFEGELIFAIFRNISLEKFKNSDWPENRRQHLVQYDPLAATVPFIRWGIHCQKSLLGTETITSRDQKYVPPKKLQYLGNGQQH